MALLKKVILPCRQKDNHSGTEKKKIQMNRGTRKMDKQKDQDSGTSCLIS